MTEAWTRYMQSRRGLWSIDPIHDGVAREHAERLEEAMTEAGNDYIGFAVDPVSEPELEMEETLKHFDPYPDSTRFSYHFPRALDAWGWFEENGFYEVDPDIFQKGVWRAELRRQPKDDGSKECWVEIQKLRVAR